MWVQGTPSLVTKFQTPTMQASNPWSSNTAKKMEKKAWLDPEVLSLHVLPDSHTLVVVTRAGDIATIPLDDDQPAASSQISHSVLWLLILFTGRGSRVRRRRRDGCCMESGRHLAGACNW